MRDRRHFVSELGVAGVAMMLGGCATGTRAGIGAQPGTASEPWDMSWLEAIRRARHRAVFDAPSGDVFLQLAARYLDNVASVYAATAPHVAAVLNVRTRATAHALADPIWSRYPIGEDAAVKEPGSDAFARRNINLSVSSGMSDPVAGATFERLRPRGAIVLVCDFALGHLANRIAKKTGDSPVAVHEAFKAGLVPGAFLVPSGIFSLAESQNAGCAFVAA